MKVKGILHPELSHLIASIGHTDYIVIADKGYPVPGNSNRINLGLTDNSPTVLQVLEVINHEFKTDRIILTEEMVKVSSENFNILKEKFPNTLFEKVTHQEFKDLSTNAKGVIKTGDTTPYANLIIVSG